MYDQNSGYIGYSRSVRSQEALEQYEIPLSLFDRTTINEFLINYGDSENNMSKEAYNYIKKLSVNNWKFIAKHYDLASSWHHTGKYYKKTDHYSLFDIVEFIVENKQMIIADIMKHKTKLPNTTYGYIKVQVWGGSRRRPVLEGYESVAGIVKGNWLYYMTGHSKRGSLRKFKIDAKKVEEFYEYNTYDSLIKTHKTYKNTKRIFNHILKSISK